MDRDANAPTNTLNEGDLAFMKIAQSLADLARKAAAAQNNGERVDPFAVFQEAQRRMQNLDAEDEVIESDKVQ